LSSLKLAACCLPLNSFFLRMIFRIILNWTSCPLHIARDSTDPWSHSWMVSSTPL